MCHHLVLCLNRFISLNRLSYLPGPAFKSLVTNPILFPLYTMDILSPFLLFLVYWPSPSKPPNDCPSDTYDDIPVLFSNAADLLPRLWVCLALSRERGGNISSQRSRMSSS